MANLDQTSRLISHMDACSRLVLIVTALTALVNGFRGQDIISILDEVFDLIQSHTAALQEKYSHTR